MGTKRGLAGSNVLVPVLVLLWAATFWGAVWYPLRLLETAGLSGLWTTWVIFATAAVMGAILAWTLSSCQYRLKNLFWDSCFSL